MIASEYAPIDWSKQWPNVNDWGHALVTFQMLADQLILPEVSHAYWWNTRWVNTSPQLVQNALTKKGLPTATGKALTFFGTHFLKKFVFSKGAPMVNTLAMIDEQEEVLRIVLINKDYLPQTTSLVINNFKPLENQVQIKHYQLQGINVDDREHLYLLK